MIVECGMCPRPHPQFNSLDECNAHVEKAHPDEYFREEWDERLDDYRANTPYGISYALADDIPWGTPDSWIPDNPNSDGFRQSDFI